MSYKAGIVKAITELKDRTGSSSISIKKHMQVRKTISRLISLFSRHCHHRSWISMNKCSLITILNNLKMHRRACPRTKSG